MVARADDRKRHVWLGIPGGQDAGDVVGDLATARGEGLRFRADWVRKLISAGDAEASAQATIPP